MTSVSRTLQDQQKLGLETDMMSRYLQEDIIKIIGYLIELINAKTDVDDIDHLSNRRVRTVGEQLYAQFESDLHVWHVRFVRG